MNNIIDIDGLHFIGKQKRKKRIVLTHTSRNVDDYIIALKNRHNGKYNKIPNFIIKNNGDILKLLPDTAYSNYFGDDNINKSSIIISLENLGWLEKIPLSNQYVNWIGDIYKQEVFEKKWRDYFYWEPYTEKQLESCGMLCNKLTNDFSIDKKCIGHNTKVDGIDKFEGIVSRSNFNSENTDLSPAFNFESFIKKIDNEQFV
jgi:N-acetyl-anhydromuramyl-L-alanine amidase AmpD